MTEQTFPIPLADFYRTLPIIENTFDLEDNRRQGLTGAGEIVTMSVGSKLWYGSLRTAPTYSNMADQIRAQLAIMLTPDASFLITPSDRRGPQSDPKGATLGASNVSISGVSANHVLVDIDGLPSGYELTRGDLFSYSEGDRYSLHHFYGSDTATAGGNITEIEVFPPMRQGYSGGVISLFDPVCAAKIVPDSYSPQLRRSEVADGLTLNWRQTL